MKTFSRRVVFGQVLGLVSMPCLAQSGKNNFDNMRGQPNFKAEDKDLIERARKTLEDLKIAEGRFSQTDYKGRKIGGKYYLSRPGKIRFEYDAPSRLLVISNGKTIRKIDPRLETRETFPLNETPLSLFLSTKIRFDQGVIISEVKKDAQGFELLLQDRRKQVEGTIRLRFIAGPKPSLASWSIRDAQGRTTHIELESQIMGKAQPKSLYET